MTPREKIQHMLIFCNELVAFIETHDFDIKPFLKSLPITNTITPFHREQAIMNEECIQKLLKIWWRTIMKRLYLTDWEFVKVISYKSVFIEHLNIVDKYYDTLYNILWDDINYHEFYIPVQFIKHKCQKHLYLKRPKESI